MAKFHGNTILMCSTFFRSTKKTKSGFWWHRDVILVEKWRLIGVKRVFMSKIAIYLSDSCQTFMKTPTRCTLFFKTTYHWYFVSDWHSDVTLALNWHPSWRQMSDSCEILLLNQWLMIILNCKIIRFLFVKDEKQPWWRNFGCGVKLAV